MRSNSRIDVQVTRNCGVDDLPSPCVISKFFRSHWGKRCFERDNRTVRFERRVAANLILS